MITHLLCPGPSLANYQPPVEPPELVVGVNRAALSHRVNIWVALDTPLIVSTHAAVIAKHTEAPLLIVGEETFGAMMDRKIVWPVEVIKQARMIEYCPQALSWTMFSATAALVCCGWKGAQRIDVYGADQAGTLDYDGVAGGQNRTEERWRTERQIWINVVEWMKEQGTEVVRHGRE